MIPPLQGPHYVPLTQQEAKPGFEVLLAPKDQEAALLVKDAIFG